MTKKADLERLMKRAQDRLNDPDLSFADGKDAETMLSVCQERLDAMIESEKAEAEAKKAGTETKTKDAKKRSWL